MDKNEIRFWQLCEAALSSGMCVSSDIMEEVRCLPSALDNLFYERFGMSAEEVFEGLGLMEHEQ